MCIRDRSDFDTRLVGQRELVDQIAARAVEPDDHVIIDVSKAHFWDISAIGALDKVVERMRRNGRSVQVVGLNRASSDLVDKFALTDKTGVEIGLAPHP